MAKTVQKVRQKLENLSQQVKILRRAQKTHAKPFNFSAKRVWPEEREQFFRLYLSDCRKKF